MDSEFVITYGKGYFEANVVWPAVFLGTYLSDKTVCNSDSFCTSYIIGCLSVLKYQMQCCTEESTGLALLIRSLIINLI